MLPFHAKAKVFKLSWFGEILGIDRGEFGRQQAWHPLLQLLHGCLASNHAAHQAYPTYVLKLWA